MKNATEVVTELYRKFPKVEFIDERDLGEDIVGLMFEYRNTEVDEEQLKAYLDSIGNWYRIRESREFYGGKSLLVKAEDDYVSLPVEDDFGYSHYDDKPEPDYLLGEAVEGERTFMLRKGVLPDGTDSMLFIVSPSNRLCIINGKEGVNDPTNTEPLYMQGEKSTIGGWEEELDKDTIVSLYLHQDGIVFDDADEEIDTDKDPEEGRFKRIASKSVQDSDGFYTDYTWYFDNEDHKHVFVFGDTDAYYPEDGYYDWEVEGDDEQAQAEAQEWFDSYNGFEEDDYNESLKEDIDEEREIDEVEELTRIVGDQKLAEEIRDYWDDCDPYRDSYVDLKDVYNEDTTIDDVIQNIQEQVWSDKDALDRDNDQECKALVEKGKALIRKLMRKKPVKESLIDDIHTDFNIARKNWKELGFSIPFDDALTIWQSKSKLAEPKWITKPIYDPDAWEDMVRMFRESEEPMKENVSGSESDWAMDNGLKKTKLKTIDDDSPVYKSKEGKYFSLGSDDKYSGTYPEYCYDSEDPASCEKQFKSGMWTNKRKFDKASGKYVKEAFDQNHADFIVDVYAHDDNLDPTEKLGQIPVSVEELYKRFDKQYVDKLLSTTPAEAFDTDRWQGYGNATNLELLIHQVAERKFHWQSPEWKEIVGDRRSCILSLPRLLNKDLLSSNIELMRKTLGKKLLPPIGWRGKRNESLKEAEDNQLTESRQVIAYDDEILSNSLDSDLLQKNFSQYVIENRKRSKYRHKLTCCGLNTGGLLDAVSRALQDQGFTVDESTHTSLYKLNDSYLVYITENGQKIYVGCVRINIVRDYPEFFVGVLELGNKHNYSQYGYDGNVICGLDIPVIKSRMSGTNESFKEDYCDMFGCESGFFTRDDLNELMDEINDKCPEGVQATGIYMKDDGRTLEVDMEDEEWGGDTIYKKIDMRKIRKPSDLLRYADSIITEFENTVSKWKES